MATLGNTTITCDFDGFGGLVTLKCRATDCYYNQFRWVQDDIYCNLKQLMIGSDGKCTSYKPVPTKEAKYD